MFIKSDTLSVLCVAIAAIWVASPLEARNAKCAPSIQVTFEMRDWQHLDQYGEANRQEIEEAARELLVASLTYRFPHLSFTESAQEHTLRCVFDKWASVAESDEKKDKEQPAGAVSWHFHLSGPLIPAGPFTSWSYREANQYYDPIVSRTELLVDFAIFLDGLDSDDEQSAKSRRDADARIARLFKEILQRVPILADWEAKHIKHTKLVVIPSSRENFHCSLPDSSMFHFSMIVRDGTLKNRHRFEAELIAEGQIDGSGVDLGDLRRALITKVTKGADAQTGDDQVELLAAGGEHSVEGEIFLGAAPPIDLNCLHTQPETFDPNSGS